MCMKMETSLNRREVRQEYGFFPEAIGHRYRSYAIEEKSKDLLIYTLDGDKHGGFNGVSKSESTLPPNFRYVEEDKGNKKVMVYRYKRLK